MSQRPTLDPSALDDSARATLRELGQLLGEARQARGQDLVDVAAYLRIKPSFLYALERGDLGLTPGRPYALGFLRTYADHLGYDGEAVVRHVRAALEAATPARPLVVRLPIPEATRPGGVAIVLSVLLATGVYAAWHLRFRGEPVIERVAAVPGELGRLASAALEAGSAADPAPPPVAAAPAETPAAAPAAAPGTPPDSFAAATPDPTAPGPATAAPPPSPVAAAPAGTAPPAAVPPAAEFPPPAADGPATARAVLAALPAATAADAAAPPAAAPARVALVAREAAWVQVRSADRGFTRSWTMAAGERFELPARDDLELWTGNAGGVEVTLDGRSLGPLGARGRVMRDVPLAPAALRARAAADGTASGFGSAQAAEPARY